LTSYKRV